MPAIRTYSVTLLAAEFKDGCFIFQPFIDDTLKFKVEAASFTELEREIRAKAKEFGKTCAVWVHLPPRERKPAGFDRWHSGMRFIKFEAPAAVEVAA